MRDSWTDRLSEYLDEELAGDEQRELERHLEDCVECARALAELRRVVARARALSELPPRADLWPGIEARLAELGAARDIEESSSAAAGPGEAGATARTPSRQMAAARGPGRRSGPRVVSLTWPQLAAAGVALALVSAGASWVLRSGPAGDAGRAGGGATGVADTAPGFASSQEVPYEVTIAELRRALAQDRGKLDPATVQVLEQNLTLIEKSIDQARRALDADPNNPYLREHLQDTMRRKLEMLQEATVVASAR